LNLSGTRCREHLFEKMRMTMSLEAALVYRPGTIHHSMPPRPAHWRELGVDVRAIKTGGGSDGNHTSAIAPTLDGMGPKGSRAHSEEEFIEVATLLERTRMLALFLNHWAADFEILA